MSEIKHYDIIIVGGGIAGLTMANLLADSKFSIAVVERFELAQPAEDPELRVSAISRASMEVFARSGALDAMLDERATAFEQMHVWDGTGAGEIHFDCADMGMETLGYIIENGRIQHALLQKLKNDGRADLLCPQTIESISLTTEPDADGHSVYLQQQELRCRLLIGADGKNSLVRKAAGIELDSASYEQKGLVCTVACESSHEHTAWQIFTPDGPLAFLPSFRRDGRDMCSIVWSLPSEKADAYVQLDETAFTGELEKAFQYRLGSVQPVTARAAFPLLHGHVDQYVQDGLALMGDAAHFIHPLAGQGANLGILDARELADVLIDAQRSGRNWSAAHTLRAYERSRKGENRLMESAMTGFNLLFTNDDPWLSMLRNAGLNMVDHAPFVKHRFMRHAMGIGS